MVSTTTATAKKVGLPAGDYRIVAWDLDTTGRRLIDEICQIAAYTPEKTYSQYVMPYKNIDMLSKKRHLICTVNVGRYRMLKDIKTGKILKTKSEISALTEFLSWLEQIHGQSGPGIILLNYEMFKLAPSLLLEALRKYQLLDRFAAVVKGFGDCYSLVKQKCDQTLNSFTLRVSTKVLLNKDDDLFNAADRARLSYQIVEHLTAGEGVGDNHNAAMVKALLEHTTTIEEEEEIIKGLKVILERQNTLRPVFAPLLRLSVSERKDASALRRLLTNAFLDYSTLKSLWDEQGKDNFSATVKEKLTDGTEEQKAEVIKILVHHFDPNLKPLKLEKKPRRGWGKRFTGKKIEMTANAATTAITTATTTTTTPAPVSADPPTTPDTTTTTSSPSKSNGVVTPQDVSPTHNSTPAPAVSTSPTPAVSTSPAPAVSTSPAKN